MYPLKFFILFLTLLLALTGFSNYLYSSSKETKYTTKYNTLAHKTILKEPDFKPLYILRSKLYKKIGLFDEVLKDIKRYESLK